MKPETASLIVSATRWALKVGAAMAAMMAVDVLYDHWAGVVLDEAETREALIPAGCGCHG